MQSHSHENEQLTTVVSGTLKRQLIAEWDMGVRAAIISEARVQAELMQTRDFRRAYEAFARRETPRFEGD